MQFKYSSPITESNCVQLCADLKTACSLRKAYKLKFYIVTLIRFFSILVAATQIYMMLFSDLKFIFPRIYSILNSTFVSYPASLGVSPYVAVLIFVLFFILFSQLIGYFIASLMEINIAKKEIYDISDMQLSEKKSVVSSLFNEYNKIDSGELTASFIMSALIGGYSLIAAVMSSEGIFMVFVAFVCSALAVFVVNVLSSSEVISETVLKKLKYDVSAFVSSNSEKEESAPEVKSYISDEEALSIEKMNPEEAFEYAKSFLGNNTKKCLEIMHIAQNKGSMQAHQFMYSLAHDCSHFSKGICVKKSVGGKVEHCFHDDGTWMMCEDYD